MGVLPKRMSPGVRRSRLDPASKASRWPMHVPYACLAIAARRPGSREVANPHAQQSSEIRWKREVHGRGEQLTDEHVAWVVDAKEYA